MRTLNYGTGTVYEIPLYGGRVAGTCKNLPVDKHTHTHMNLYIYILLHVYILRHDFYFNPNVLGSFYITLLMSEARREIMNTV